MINAAGIWRRLHRVAFNRDGQAPALEALAQIGPAQAPAGAGDEPAAAVPQGSRRGRPTALPQTILLDALSHKVLLAWLQNRHQTLYPLTLNLRSLKPDEVELVVQAMAAAMLADGDVKNQEREQAAGALRTIGGGDAEHRTLVAALDTQMPLAALLRSVQDAGISTYAYAASLLAVNQRSTTNQLYLEYLGARLAIPIDVILSLNRRYRR